MGHYVSIRGWIGCEAGDIFVIQEINKKFLWNYSNYQITYQTKELYQKGWCFPNEFINWTNYVFYGADIRQYHSDFIKELIAIAESNHEIEGHFSVDDDEGVIKQYWNLTDGKLTVIERSE
ncbi:hypothetical protein [Pseudobacteroides cellulosolvens]|uniref:Uncharacterized protein n=1 Tax=Pseudobacteroides cellulosolvens ATCC 35603 = DSM 2933 TaxID=398512 RepID=A0A0L6JJH6_9FIRM|nr:hypothetical protein [Pseudobacteroides cellulosolvens]KNY25890.1 hypothetical protein Bccel_1150 [Pseudobacteroides cellulosolvens ATCC 35603 = DSM 2933]